MPRKCRNLSISGPKTTGAIVGLVEAVGESDVTDSGIGGQRLAAGICWPANREEILGLVRQALKLGRESPSRGMIGHLDAKHAVFGARKRYERLRPLSSTTNRR